MFWRKTFDSLSWEGRIGRADFWRQYIMLVIPLFVLGIFGTLTASVILEWIAWSIYAFLTIRLIFLVFKRLRDVGKLGWWIFGLIAPGLNIYVLYLLFLKKGNTV